MLTEGRQIYPVKADSAILPDASACCGFAAD